METKANRRGERPATLRRWRRMAATGLTAAWMALSVVPTLAACSTDGDGSWLPTPPAEQEPDTTAGATTEKNDTMDNRLTLTVGDDVFTVTLADNAAAAAFRRLLPLRLEMEELNGNEKYAYLDAPLPTAAVRPGTIEAGDVMLFGASCVVVFYETFRTSYAYTPLGRVDRPEALAAALGRGGATVTFALP